MKYRSLDGCYYKGFNLNDNGERVGELCSAYQRKEILEGETKLVNGVEHMAWKVIGHWKDYEKAKAEVEAFNRNQDEANV